MNGPLPTTRLVASPSCLDDLLRHDPEDRRADGGLERGERVLQRELDDLLARGAARWPRCRRSVFCGETFMNRSNDHTTSAAVTGRPFIGALVVPLGVGPQVEGVGLAVRADLPGLGEVALHDVRLGRDARPLLGHQQAAVEEGRELLHAEADVQVRIERRRILGGDVGAEDAAVLRGVTGTVGLASAAGLAASAGLLCGRLRGCGRLERPWRAGLVRGRGGRLRASAAWLARPAWRPGPAGRRRSAAPSRGRTGRPPLSASRRVNRRYGRPERRPSSAPWVIAHPPSLELTGCTTSDDR